MNERKYTCPRYPVYIVSKGRHDSMLTSKSLAKIRVPHYIAVEPQDIEPYKKALIEFNLSEFATLLELPFSNHGDGPGRARNWCWDHSMTLSAEKHWVLDDNIVDFYRLHMATRIRVGTGLIFKIAEDFVDRYENVPLAGFGYRFLVVPGRASRPPFVHHSRVYSCMLIDNQCKYRWRGRYNEDTDLCLRVLKDGDCIIQFNCFLQGKAATQTVKGGNTLEFYESEIDNDRADGTIRKSQMLVDLHPDVASIVFRHGRWHHHVNYEVFRKNRLRLKPDIILPSGYDNYGMTLTDK